MRVIIGKSVYEMDAKQADGVLSVVKKQVPCGIYALKKGDVIELEYMPYKYKKNLNKAVAKYVKRGFKVYYNGGSV